MPQICGEVRRADSGALGISDAESVIAMFATRCRPGESRDPYAEPFVVKDRVYGLSRNTSAWGYGSLRSQGRRCVDRLSRNISGLGLGVRPFAGTTRRKMMREPPSSSAHPATCLMRAINSSTA